MGGRQIESSSLPIKTIAYAWKSHLLSTHYWSGSVCVADEPEEYGDNEGRYTLRRHPGEDRRNSFAPRGGAIPLKKTARLRSQNTSAKSADGRRTADWPSRRSGGTDARRGSANGGFDVYPLNRRSVHGVRCRLRVRVLWRSLRGDCDKAPKSCHSRRCGDHADHSGDARLVTVVQSAHFSQLISRSRDEVNLNGVAPQGRWRMR
jgi:hypothetical protein